ncbi:alpha/beta hydrolase [Kineobactrum salinum]|uniref:Palmitoyl-protein thioesterase ABHD10, mitochondrial n=1 Tax=Kineobactrum salinum TaxID=2708301 RepID=A0A6C0U4L3_9GAMM|nr:alpha/beta hydrolase [Kineobactrum salinum]QIB67041.1 alpha/beta hydrolase [Kineobactrum salinum]
MTTAAFTSPEGHRLAYRCSAPRDGTDLTFVWLSGFKSDMTGTKAAALEAWAAATGHGFLAFDYSGHGQSEGVFEEGCVSVWREDALAVIDALSSGPVVLVGSSMGGWLALLVALARPARVKGMLLIAPAPDFTENLLWATMPEQAREEVRTRGYTLRPSQYGEPYTITRRLIVDGRGWLLLGAPIPFEGPVRILQGMRDPDVPWQYAERLLASLTSDDVVLTLVKDGDHRLSRVQDLSRLTACCAELAARGGDRQR